ncbi:ADP-ribosylglycohydrolase family protein [Mariniplasma anaerobium]|uniref:ADP-ribosylglycohydrolase n=1 Tax=Mariniplasma anaerobium TaxID=2735436 RepID=A0A7U9TLI4_9MOLU|nr:ADP-ribosylglycohydrolase family protein [Mariniplasma anaerobium]BCR36172.1 hypothetical protein MPAN_010650 [Mariniplasma anaerobium]
MKKYIYPALLANAATLGVHWIYNVQYLQNLSEKQSLLFLVQDEQVFKQAAPSFFAYPNTVLGDLSVQGEILKWLYDAKSSNNKFNQADYKTLLLSKFLPGGSYKGYVESYGKKLVAIDLLDQLKTDSSQITLNDDQLVGFIPYILAKELDLSLDDAWSLASLFTKQSFYLDYYRMFDSILENPEEENIKHAIEQSLILAPKDKLPTLEKAIQMSNTNDFIEEYAGRACSVDDAIPVIIHVLYHSTSFEDALNINAKIGGASADRSLLIGAILSQVYDIPTDWNEKVSPKLILK